MSSYGLAALGVVVAGGGAASSGGDPTTLVGLLQTGGFTALAAVLLFFARTAYKRETDRADRLEEEGRKTNELIRDRVMPSLEKASTALEQATLVMIQIQERLRDDELLARSERRRLRVRERPDERSDDEDESGVL